MMPTKYLLLAYYNFVVLGTKVGYFLLDQVQKRRTQKWLKRSFKCFQKLLRALTHEEPSSCVSHGGKFLFEL